MRSTKDSIKKVFVALGYGSSVSEYSGKTVAEVLKEGAVKMGIAPSKSSIKATTTSEVLDYIADNYGDEEHDPFDLDVTKTNCTISVKRNGEEVTPGDDILFTGDVLTITATANEGYEVSSLTVNGVSFVSGSTYIVTGNVAIVGTASLEEFDLQISSENTTITVTRGDETLDDLDTIYYGDVLTITATPTVGYELDALNVNGETFVSGSTFTVNKDGCVIDAVSVEPEE